MLILQTTAVGLAFLSFMARYEGVPAGVSAAYSRSQKSSFGLSLIG
jgi:hypothetical protein